MMASCSLQEVAGGWMLYTVVGRWTNCNRMPRLYIATLPKPVHIRCTSWAVDVEALFHVTFREFIRFTVTKENIRRYKETKR